jgi:exonuclease SbcC
VLFGDPLHRSYDYLLRENAEEGKVSAVFVHNNKTYKIERALQRKGTGINQDINQLKFYKDDKIIAENKNDAVSEELKALTGLDKNIFREVVWVRQEHLKELLDITPRHRQKKIDQLFGLSDYELAWNNLLQFKREYEIEKNIHERDGDVIRCSKLETDYMKTVEEFSSANNELENRKGKHKKIESVLNEASTRLENLEELRKITEDLQRRKILLQANLSNNKNIVKKFSEQIKNEKARMKILETLIEKMVTQKKQHIDNLEQTGLEKEEIFEETRNYLLSIEEELRKISGKKEAIKRENETAIKRITNFITENKCPTCFQNISEDYKENITKKIKKEKIDREKKLEDLEKNYEDLKNIYSKVNFAFSNIQQIIPRINDLNQQFIEKQESVDKLTAEIKEKMEEEKNLLTDLEKIKEQINKFDVSDLEEARNQQKKAYTEYLNSKHQIETLNRTKNDLAIRIDDLKERLDNTQKKIERKEKLETLIEIIDRVRTAYRTIQPKLRREFVMYLQKTVQQILNGLTGDVEPSLILRIDETYSPFVKSEEGYEREVLNLSGGERTLLAFAYRIGLGQLIMQSRTGHGLFMLLLDEPTESLGREDGSVERLADAINRLKAIEQIIAVTHNEAFAEKAEHVIRIEKKEGKSEIFQ